MKHSVSKLEGALLDAAVAKAHGWRFEISPSVVSGDACFAAVPDLEHGDGNGLVGFAPSSCWEDAGPIIAREGIMLIPCCDRRNREVWSAHALGRVENRQRTDRYLEYGMQGVGLPSSPLVAAMRAFVERKFGGEVDLP